eukprot:UN00976
MNGGCKDHHYVHTRIKPTSRNELPESRKEKSNLFRVKIIGLSEAKGDQEIQQFIRTNKRREIAGQNNVRNLDEAVDTAVEKMFETPLADYNPKSEHGHGSAMLLMYKTQR